MPATPSNIISNGVDLSTYGDGATFQKAGKKFVVRYLSPNSRNIPQKKLTLAEIDDYTRHDLMIGVVWETTTSRARAGYDAGRNDAQLSQQSIVGLHLPVMMAVYFAIDEDTTGPLVSDYFRGCADELGLARIGAYGGIKPLSWLFNNHQITYGWQTFAWSNGQLDPRCQAYQHQNSVSVGGYDCDLNYQLANDFGQMNPDGTLGDTTVTQPVDLTDAAVEKIAAKPIYVRPAGEQTDQGLSLAWAARGAYFRGGYLANTFAPSVMAQLAALAGDENQTQAAIQQLHDQNAAMQADLDTIQADLTTLPAEVADAVVAKLPPDMQGMTPDQIKQIVIDGTAEVVNNTTAKLTYAPPAG